MTVSKKYIFFFFAVLFSLGAMAQQKKIETIKFKVGANCGQCEARVEKALDVKGIKFADLDLEDNICTVSYSTKVFQEDDIYRLVTAAGHDTKKIRCTENEYGQIEGCCLYRGGHGDVDHDHSKDEKAEEKSCSKSCKDTDSKKK